MVGPPDSNRSPMASGSSMTAMKYAVVGAGSWGTTVAVLLSRSVDTVIWARSPEVAAEITDRHRNSAYLPGFDLPPSITATTDIAEAASDADVIVMGVPSHGYRSVLNDFAPHVGPSTPVLSAPV